ncbi:MAG: glycosyltransferase [Chitinophagaceae bacterium]|jgi:glycosyltransferase involved in cell wall biosynthesis|nr:glycosyltransferase [Chitinophagaceae bacterium]
MARIIMIGPGHPLRGGLSTFNQRLAKEFIHEGHECSIYSFSLQYPSILFPGKTQYSDESPPENLRIESAINSINPLNWIKVGNSLKRERPDIIFVRFWLPFMGPALGTILRRIKTNNHTKIICIADNIIPHEKRPGDKPFTNYFIKSCDAFIVMSETVLKDLRSFEKNKPAQLVPHPLFDNFGELITKTEARKHLGIPVNEKVILFFGFIRKYKGLDILLEAMQILKNKFPHSAATGVKLMVAGEFYEDEKNYRELIAQMDLAGDLYLHTSFITDSEVKYYLGAADVIVQPYRNATQSGVTPLAYHFEKPTIVTNVGGLPAMVVDNKTGLITEPDAEHIASTIAAFYELGENYFIPHLRLEKQKYSWHNMVRAVLQLAEEV